MRIRQTAPRWPSASVLVASVVESATSVTSDGVSVASLAGWLAKTASIAPLMPQREIVAGGERLRARQHLAGVVIDQDGVGVGAAGVDAER